MKKLLILITILLLASTCYARQEVASNVSGSITSGQQVNISSSTAVQLGTGNIMSVIIHAPQGNKGYLYIGNSGLTSSNGFKLSSGATITVNTDNLDNIFVLGDPNVTTATTTAVYIGS